MLNMGAPKGCVLSPLLYKHDSNTINKFADDTTVVGLIMDNDETAYREEVRDLAVWCQGNKHSLNAIKAKEIIVNYRKRRMSNPPHSHQLVFRGLGCKLQVPWCPHHQQTIMVQTHQGGTTVPISPQETERICHGFSKSSTAAPSRAS
jgi:hypothetical protein